VVDNKPYKMQQYTFVLFPQHEGKHTIAPIKLTYAIPEQPRAARTRHGFFDEAFLQSFFGTQPVQKHTHSNGLTLVVTPVPHYQEPLDGVGTFSQFTAEISKHESSVGEPVTLSFTLKGHGNLEQIALPKPQLPDDFRCYESKTMVDENLETDYHGGTKTVEFIVQAMKPGTWTIPAQTFTFYDTAQKIVKKIATNPLSLVIKQGAQQLPHVSTIATTQEEHTTHPIEPFAQDISFIQENFMDSTNIALPWWLFIALMVAPLIFLYRTTFQRLWAYFRHLHNRGGVQKFAHFKRELDRLSNTNEVTSLHHFFMQVLAQYAPQSGQLSEQDIETLLTQKGWTAHKISEFLDYLSICAQFRFTTTQAASSLNCHEIFKKAHYWLVLLNH
jgi:hypothetical protein